MNFEFLIAVITQYHHLAFLAGFADIDPAVPHHAFKTADPAGLPLRLRPFHRTQARCGAVLRRSLPISPFWWASYTDPSGQRTRRSTGATNRKEAEALLAKWRVETHRRVHWNEQPTRTFDELMLFYLRATEGEKRAAERDRYSAKRLYPYFTGRELQTLTAADVRGYMEHRREAGAGNATINRELGLLSAALNYAKREWEWDCPNPVIGRKLREPEGRVRWIKYAEAQTLIGAAERVKQAPHLADFIRLALHTGMRAGELLGLEWERVDLQVGLIHLEADHTKAGKRRSVPMNAVAREAMMSRLRFRAQHKPDSPWVFCDTQGQRIANVKHSFATARKAAGIKDFRIHDLRHTCAAWLVSVGVPLTEVRDLLGHSTVIMTERYAHLAPERIRDAVSRLEGAASRLSHVADISKVVSIAK